jgi:hypothetical protein
MIYPILVLFLEVKLPDIADCPLICYQLTVHPCGNQGARAMAMKIEIAAAARQQIRKRYQPGKLKSSMHVYEPALAQLNNRPLKQIQKGLAAARLDDKKCTI